MLEGRLSVGELEIEHFEVVVTTEVGMGVDNVEVVDNGVGEPFVPVQDQSERLHVEQIQVNVPGVSPNL